MDTETWDQPALPACLEALVPQPQVASVALNHGTMFKQCKEHFYPAREAGLTVCLTVRGQGLPEACIPQCGPAHCY